MLKSFINLLFNILKFILIIAGIIYFINYFNIKSFPDNSLKTILTTTASDLFIDSHLKDIIEFSSNIKSISPDTISLK